MPNPKKLYNFWDCNPKSILIFGISMDFVFCQVAVQSLIL